VAGNLPIQIRSSNCIDQYNCRFQGPICFRGLCWTFLCTDSHEPILFLPFYSDFGIDGLDTFDTNFIASLACKQYFWLFSSLHRTNFKSIIICYTYNVKQYVYTICGSFKSTNHQKVRSANVKSAKSHICGKSANLKNNLGRQICKFVELICGLLPL
jgi:hypothetical protein